MDLWCSFDTIGAGINLVSCWSRDCPYPVGSVWGIAFGEDEQGAKRRFEVLHSYVDPRWRRRGVRTFINRQIFEAGWLSEVITTHSGTPDGMAFMNSAGYSRSPDSGVLYLPAPGKGG